MDELSQMKESLSLLHEKLKTQPIVNDRLLAETCKLKINSLHHKTLYEPLCSLLIGPLVVWILYSLHYSTPFLVFSAFIIALEALTSLFIRRDLDLKTLANASMSEVGRRVLRFKMRHVRGFCFFLVLAIIWLTWLISEILLVQQYTSEHTMILIAATLISSLIGGYIGYRIDRNILRNAENILKDMNEA